MQSSAIYGMEYYLYIFLKHTEFQVVLRMNLILLNHNLLWQSQEIYLQVQHKYGVSRYYSEKMKMISLI